MDNTDNTNTEPIYLDWKCEAGRKVYQKIESFKVDGKWVDLYGEDVFTGRKVESSCKVWNEFIPKAEEYGIKTTDKSSLEVVHGCMELVVVWKRIDMHYEIQSIKDPSDIQSKKKRNKKKGK